MSAKTISKTYTVRELEEKATINCGGYLHGDDPVAACHKILAAISQ